jgi:hypothetical protein
MAVKTFLDLSTAHLTANDVTLLEREVTPIRVLTYPEGFLVPTGALYDADFRTPAVLELRALKFSETFIALLMHGVKLGAWYVRFDADEDIDSGLPVGRYGMDEKRSPELRPVSVDNDSYLVLRYAVCEEYAFDPLSDSRQETVRWVMDLAVRQIVVMQRLDQRTRLWEDMERSDRARLADNLTCGENIFGEVDDWYERLNLCDTIPDWSSRSYTADEAA